MRITRTLRFGLCCLAVGLMLQGCRDEEQGRVLHFDKGSYLGPADESLTEEQVEALRQRALNQQI